MIRFGFWKDPLGCSVKKRLSRDCRGKAGLGARGKSGDSGEIVSVLVQLRGNGDFKVNERYLGAKLKRTWKQSLMGTEGCLELFCAHLWWYTVLLCPLGLFYKLKSAALSRNHRTERASFTDFWEMTGDRSWEVRDSENILIISPLLPVSFLDFCLRAVFHVVCPVSNVF